MNLWLSLRLVLLRVVEEVGDGVVVVAVAAVDTDGTVEVGHLEEETYGEEKTFLFK